MLDDKTPWANVASFVFVVLATIGFVVLGYFHGIMMGPSSKLDVKKLAYHT